MTTRQQLARIGAAFAFAIALSATAATAPALAFEAPIEAAEGPVALANGVVQGVADSTAPFVAETTANTLGAANEAASFGLGTAGVGLPSLPELPADVSGLPALPAEVPGLPAAPAALPSLPGLPGLP